MDGGSDGFSLSNLRGTPLTVLIIVIAALLLQLGFAWQFRGHVQL